MSSNVSTVTTWPRSEQLIHQQDTFYLQGEFRNDFPLGQLFQQEDYRPKLEGLIDTTCWASYCSRAFVGTWEINEGQLYLSSLAYCCGDTPIQLSSVFREASITQYGVAANWVTLHFTATSSAYPYDQMIADQDTIKSFSISFKNGLLWSFKPLPDD